MGMIVEKRVLICQGERQRISIARGLLKNSSVLLMDEATAKYIMMQVLELENMLRIVVTHSKSAKAFLFASNVEKICFLVK